MKEKILYFITDSSTDPQKFFKTVEAACKGGADIIQLREKNRTTREYIELAEKVKKITDSYNIPLIIDDRVDVCLACNASGVHLGADDMDIATARKILGQNKIIGATAKTLKRAEESEKSGADYLGVGAIFPTTTKVKTVITDVAVLSEIAENSNIPVYAIGGLNAENIDILNNSGISGVCAVSAIRKAENPEEYVRNFRRKINMLK